MPAAMLLLITCNKEVDLLRFPFKDLLPRSRSRLDETEVSWNNSSLYSYKCKLSAPNTMSTNLKLDIL